MTSPSLRLWRSLRRLPARLIVAQPNTPPDVFKGLALFWVDGLFIAFSYSFYNPFLPLFLLGFGANNSQVGLMTGASSLLGILSYMAAMRATHAIGGRQRIVVFSRASRLMLLLVALVPFAVPRAASIPVTIALVALQVTLENLGSPAWTALVADIVPLEGRARYIASRSTVKNLTRTIGVAAAGQLIRALGFPSGYSASFVLGGLLGLSAGIAYAHIPMRQEQPHDYQAATAGRDLLSNKRLLLYMGARTLWTFGYQMAAPFYAVYVVRNLGGDARLVGLLTGAGSMAAIAGLMLYGPLVERLGMRRSWLLSSLADISVPLLWLVARSGWFGLLPYALDGALMAGLEVVNLNTLLVLTDARQRTQFAAVTSTILSLATLAGPLFGGALSDRVGFGPVFVLAAALSLVGCVLYYLFVPEPRLQMTDTGTSRPMAGRAPASASLPTPGELRE